MRRAVAAVGSGIGRIVLVYERTANQGGLAAVWQQAAHDVNAFLHAAAAPGCPRSVSSTSTNAAASSVQQRASVADRHAAHRNCWQCGSQLAPDEMFFCPACHSIQPPDSDAEAKYFDVFGLDQFSFDINQEELEQRYKQLQRQLHPDKFSIHSDLEKEYSDHQATLVNQAYDVLKKPLRRAHYILQQQGLGACEGLTITDPELLMYVMEAREEVEGTEDKERLQQLLEESKEQEGRCVQELSEAFRQGDLGHAAEITTQLRYVKRIQEAIIDKL